MRVLVAGATGAIGRQLVPVLTSAGHEVIGLAKRDPGLPAGSRVRMVLADALDGPAVAAAVRQANPDAVVNMLTAIPARINPRRMAREFGLTNRLRTEGTHHVLSAAAATGVRRIIAQGLAYAYDPAGRGPADEDQPLWRRPPAQFAPVLRALTELEQRTRDAGGLVLRLGHLYGPGTIYAPGGSFVEQVRAGKVPLVGGGRSVFSFTHTDDVATAVLAALDSDATGVLNVVDDDPATVATWLPVLAGMLAAPQPRRVPSALARLAVGGWGVAFMTQLRGADNGRARRTLNWRPRHRSWRDGFAHEFRTQGPAWAESPMTTAPIPGNGSGPRLSTEEKR
jgi:nucleoside-diphosphate-sugar epimerase